MNAEHFAYWLQGFAEVHGEPPTAEQWAIIKEHLQLLFHKVTGPGIAIPQGQRVRDDWSELQPQCAIGQASVSAQAIC